MDLFRKLLGKTESHISLYNIDAAIQRFLREKDRPDISFFDVKAPEFDLVQKSLDARMKELTSDGVGQPRTFRVTHSSLLLCVLM